MVILAEGGLTTRWADVRRAIGPGLALATVGVAVSVAVTAAVVVGLLDSRWGFALLLARGRSAPPTRPRSSPRCAGCRCRAAWPPPLEVESGLNDAPVILLVVGRSPTGSPAAPHGPWWLTRAGGRRPSWSAAR